MNNSSQKTPLPGTTVVYVDPDAGEYQAVVEPAKVDYAGRRVDLRYHDPDWRPAGDLPEDFQPGRHLRAVGVPHVSEDAAQRHWREA